MMKLNPAATITEEFAERIKSENRSAKMMKLAPSVSYTHLTLPTILRV